MRILVTSTPGMGHLNALLPLMFALQDAGHDLLVVTAAESCERVAGYGFNVRAGGLAGNAASRHARTIECPRSWHCHRDAVEATTTQAFSQRAPRRSCVLLCNRSLPISVPTS